MSDVINLEEKARENIKAIIFDMDGLMFDTEKLWGEAYKEVAKKWGLETKITEEVRNSCRGRCIKEIRKLFKELVDEMYLEREGREFPFEEYMNEHVEYIGEHINNNGISIKEGLIELLKYAHENNLKTAMATSSEIERVQYYLEKAGINRNQFDAIICGDMVQKGKPEPDVFIKACEDLSVSPEESIVLEDSLNGIIAAYKAGTNPIMVVDCVEPTDEIRSMLCTNPLNSLVEVKRILETMK